MDKTADSQRRTNIDHAVAAESLKSQFKNCAQSMVNLAYPESGKRAELSDQSIVIENSNLLCECHGILRQTSFSRRNEYMARQQPLAYLCGERNDDGVWTILIRAIGLHDRDRAHARLFGSACRR